MKSESLNKQLKAQHVIETNLGEFEYCKSIGEGGNSFVYHFKKSNKDFAIKFLKPLAGSKISRFKDEFFCTMQMPEHKNIVKYLHFDKVKVSTYEYNIIVMKLYKKTLNAEGDISALDEEEKNDRSWKLFSDMASALSHLHKNGVYHRDVKPGNIFYDEDVDSYVLGDLGIAHFNEELFSKDSETKPSERMANWGYSAPEQLNSKSKVVAASDIFSLGQVINEYLTGHTVRGVSRVWFSNNDSPVKLKLLDKIVEKSLKSSEVDRFQSINEILDFIKEKKAPKEPNYWPILHSFDDVILKSFPKINGVYSTSDEVQITRFITNFQNQCDVGDFWYVNMDGGDSYCGEIKKIGQNRLLFCNEVEMKLNKLIAYENSGHPYKDFFILLLDPDECFDIVDESGSTIDRVIPDDWASDYATYWNGRYIDHNETRNGYYEFKNDIIKVDREIFQDRIRHLHKYAYIIIPKGTASALMGGRVPAEAFLKNVVASGEITDAALQKYEYETRRYHSDEITRYN
jgi:serine/threonine protein kinase